MGTLYLRGLVLGAVVLASVANAQTAYELDMPSQVGTWFQPQPVQTIDEDDNVTINTPASDALTYETDSGDTWVSWIMDYVIAIMLWLTTPICLLIEAFMDWMGMAEALPNPFDFSTGSLGLWASIANAWIPATELIFFATTTLIVNLVWLPFRIIIKYLIPGLG